MDHLKEATFYSPKDLDGLGSQLKECRRYVERGQEEYSPHLLTLLDARIKVCEDTLATLRLNLSHLTPELTPKWDKLVSLLRSLAGCNARSKFPNDEVDAYAKELYELEEELKKDGITAYETTGSTEDKLIEMTEKMKLTAAEEDPAPQAETLISQLLRRNLLWVALIREKSDNSTPWKWSNADAPTGKGASILRSRTYTTSFCRFGTNLRSCRSHKRGLCARQTCGISNVNWTALMSRELRTGTFTTHLGDLQRSTSRGYDLLTRKVVLRLILLQTLLYLLRKSYAIIYQLLLTSEPVSEALLPIYNQLTTLRKCLLEVKKLGGVSSPRELYPYSMKVGDFPDRVFCQSES